MRNLRTGVHDASNSKIVPQIIHFMKVARSGWRQTIDSLSLADMDRIVDEFAAAAARAREAGYDGVELHSAHAYNAVVVHLQAEPAARRLFRPHPGGAFEDVRPGHGGGAGAGRRRLPGRRPVLAEECIKDGYTVEDAKLIALRMAQLGVDYISLSVGGKFEDAIHRAGQPLYPYTGYSGDRCMPGDWYPPLPHAHLAATIRDFIRAKGQSVPVVSVGKISGPADAERLLQDDKADIVGMARQLLADPDWANKVAAGRGDAIVRCIYCNVCKMLDENFKEVHCFLWPKGARQAPPDRPDAAAPTWGADGAALTAEYANGAVKLTWQRAEGQLAAGQDIAGYDIYRAEDDGATACVEAVKGARYVDRTVLGGLTYTYYVRAYDATGRATPPSNSVVVAPPIPVTGQDQVGPDDVGETEHA